MAWVMRALCSNILEESTVSALLIAALAAVSAAEGEGHTAQEHERLWIPEQTTTIMSLEELEGLNAQSESLRAQEEAAWEQQQQEQAERRARDFLMEKAVPIVVILPPFIAVIALIWPRSRGRSHRRRGMPFVPMPKTWENGR